MELLLENWASTCWDVHPPDQTLFQHCLCTGLIQGSLVVEPHYWNWMWILDNTL